KDKAFEFKQKRMMKTVQSQRANAAGQNGSQFHYGTVSRSSASNTSVQRVKGARQTQKTIKQSARNSKNAIKTSAKGTVKTTQKSVKTAQATSKTAIKTTQATAKSAQVAAKASAKTAPKAAQAARATAKASATAVKTTAKATVSAVKAIIAGTKALIAAIVAGGWVAVIIILIVVLLGCAVSLFGGGGNSNAYTPVSAEVEAYDPLIRQYASQHGIPEYVELIKAVMMQESGGRGNDPMQASECGYNTRYPNTPNGITDPEYSIDVGIQNLADCLNAAEVENPVDMEHIKLALQGYNFGNGYISWAKNNYGGYSYANAVEFSAIQAERLGWDSYGDTQYVAHVLRYYPYGRAFTSGGNQAIVEVALTQLGNVGGEPYWSWYGFDSRVEWCACFVSWCAEQCGYLESGIIPKYSLCSDGVNWFRNNGQWQGRDYEPTAGNLIFFDWEGDGTIDHTGIVEKSENGTVYTVEGNSGDECKQRNYPVGSSVIYGYGIPAY
ncbi:TPA: lysozyme family protein, partial [Clostridioides difficile]|nr:lysozyme family protein [Clostridioides difficile]